MTQILLEAFNRDLTRSFDYRVGTLPRTLTTQSSDCRFDHPGPTGGDGQPDQDSFLTGSSGGFMFGFCATASLRIPRKRCLEGSGLRTSGDVAWGRPNHFLNYVEHKFRLVGTNASRELLGSIRALSLITLQAL